MPTERAGDGHLDEPDVATTEFEDTDSDVGHFVRRLQLNGGVLRDPVVLRSIAGVIVAVAILAWPDRTDTILARLIGLGLVILGGITIWGALRRTPRDMIRAAGAAIVAGVGLPLLTTPPQEADDLLGRGIGALAILAAVSLVLDIGRKRPDERGWPLAQAGLMASIGLLLLRFPETLLQTVVAMFGVGWLLLSGVAIARSLDPDVDGVSSNADTATFLADWLRDRPKSADDRQELYAKILYEGPDSSKRIGRFFTLMGFASLIAAGGVIGDSTAVVIGAMLIAPLMTPLMGMAISLVMGWPKRLAQSATIAAAGIVVAIGIGVLMGVVTGLAIDTATNGQIVARTSPTTLDLLVAIAAGAAGAYGLSRPDVSDSLPGVAIAISLVPPLSVVGLSISQGDWGAAGGALLLFATNMIAILVVGGLTFVITGVTPIERLAANQHRTRTSIAAIAGIGLFVIGALLLNGTEIARNVAIQNDVDRAVAAWLEPHVAYDVVNVAIDGDTITAVIIGPAAAPPPAETLANRLTAELDRETTAVVRLVVEERDTATGVSRP